MMVKAGVYEHYKGNKYQVLGIATHSETEEKLVAYRPMYGDMSLWVRPLAMFVESIEVSGETVPRFKFLYSQE